MKNIPGWLWMWVMINVSVAQLFVMYRVWKGDSIQIGDVKLINTVKVEKKKLEGVLAAAEKREKELLKTIENLKKNARVKVTIPKKKVPYGKARESFRRMDQQIKKNQMMRQQMINQPAPGSY